MLKLEFKVGILCIFQSRFVNLSLNDFLVNFVFEKNREMLPHDRDIVYHDCERSSTSRALLGLTVLDILVCSRSHITTVISYIMTVMVLTINHHDHDSCEADSEVLTTVAHDRDHTLPARDLKKKNFNWFILEFYCSV